MSQSKQPADDPADGTVASRTRSQTRIRPRDESDEEKQPAQSSAHVSPAMRLYRHALESIFTMLELEDLSHALAVSRSWSAAVRSMKSIGATIERDQWDLQRAGKVFHPLPPIRSLVTLPLLRHLAAIHIEAAMPDFRSKAMVLTSESLALLAQHAPHLASLWCNLTLTPGAPLLWPTSLTSLRIQLSGELPASGINCMLISLAALPFLRQLTLRSLTLVDVDLSLLGSSPSLLDLGLEGLGGGDPGTTDDQVAQICTSLGHLQRFPFGYWDSDRIARFLQPPVTVRWRDIGTVSVDARTSDLLANLPTLTRLHLYYEAPAPAPDFLAKLPTLSALMLTMRSAAMSSISPNTQLCCLLPCTGLTELTLHCMFNSAQGGTLLAALTKLRKLKLWAPLETLRCFASGPATQTLGELDISGRSELARSELIHVYALRRLRALSISGLFVPQLDDAAIDSLSPPTQLLPMLTDLRCRWVSSDPSGAWVERKGPSFEWTQARLTQ